MKDSIVDNYVMHTMTVRNINSVHFLYFFKFSISLINLRTPLFGQYSLNLIVFSPSNKLMNMTYSQTVTYPYIVFNPGHEMFH